MEKSLVHQFERVEKALATLVASIATYNPNPALAQELVDADGELNNGLEELLAHQRNHARIQSLKATSDALDSELKTTLQTLSTTRAELIATPATKFPYATYPIHYNELLSFARRIAKFTLPPTYRETPPTLSQPSSLPASAAPTNGTTTPVEASPAAGSMPSMPGITITSLTNGSTTSPVPPSATENTALPPHLASWLNPHLQANDFAPWPSEETIRRGALAQIQVLVDEGKDPATWDPETAAHLAAREAEEVRKREEEYELKQEQERQAQVAKMEQQAKERAEGRAREQATGGTAGVAQPQGQEKKAYTGLDDLDDDSD